MDSVALFRTLSCTKEELLRSLRMGASACNPEDVSVTTLTWAAALKKRASTSVSQGSGYIEVYSGAKRWLPLLLRRAAGCAARGIAET
jgi:hypothetical protein